MRWEGIVTEQGPRPQIHCAIADGVAVLTIANRRRMNALTAAMWQQLPEHIHQADQNPEVRVVLVRGEGESAFSAGADISEFELNRQGNAATAYNDLNHRAFDAILTCAKPTIAMVHGFCLGGGLAIAACCDLRIAGACARFAIPAARLGIGYDPRWLRPLLRLASPAAVKEILFTGHRFNVEEARALGLVNRIVPSTELEGSARALAAEISANAPLTIRAAKASIDQLSQHAGTADIGALDNLVAACFSSDDYVEGRRAFLEIRAPKVRGQ